MFKGEEEEDSDKEEQEELDKKMGDLGEGQTDTLDERLWGDDEDDQEEEGSDKEEESGQGMDQVRIKPWTNQVSLKAMKPFNQLTLRDVNTVVSLRANPSWWPKTTTWTLPTRTRTRKIRTKRS